MATSYLYLKGKTRWVKLNEPDEKYSNWSVEFYPDEESLVQIKGSGLQITPKEDEEGVYYKVRRPTEKIIKKELVTFGKPETINADGTPFEGILGNGSDVTVKLCVYDSAKGKAHRLEKVRVDKLVVYTPTDAGSELPKF